METPRNRFPSPPGLVTTDLSGPNNGVFGSLAIPAPRQQTIPPVMGTQTPLTTLQTRHSVPSDITGTPNPPRLSFDQFAAAPISGTPTPSASGQPTIRNGDNQIVGTPLPTRQSPATSGVISGDNKTSLPPVKLNTAAIQQLPASTAVPSVTPSKHARVNVNGQSLQLGPVPRTKIPPAGPATTTASPLPSASTTLKLGPVKPTGRGI